MARRRQTKALRRMALLVASLLAVADPALSWAEEISPRVDVLAARAKVTGKLVPDTLGPRQMGTLLVTIDPGPGLKIENTNLKWEPLASAGVTLDAEGGKTPAPDKKTVDEWGDPHQFWTKPFTLKVPVSLGDNVADGSFAGLTVRYTLCTDDSCGTEQAADVKVPVGAPQAVTLSKSIHEEEGAVSIHLSEDGKALVVRFAPSFGWHMYLPGAKDGEAIRVTPKEADGVTFGPVTIPSGGKFSNPMDVRVPFERAPQVKAVQVHVRWAGCSTMGQCMPPREHTLGAAFAPEAVEAVARVDDTPKEARGEIAFPVVEDDDIERPVNKEGEIGKLLKEKGLPVVLGILFLIGVGLAFTPCVFPIIPLVVATIGGGGVLPKRRLSVLLGTYVLGMCLAFSTLGLISAFGGGSMAAAFTYPAVQWGFVILFVLLAFGMLGLFELQPPQWLMNLQGGAQSKGGSLLGAFLLGVLGAILASPCTGPVIAGLLLFTAKTQDVLLGFSLFFVLGLGMGAVFFAFGSLNFALRPGPWMVWVRYVFGMLLFGGAIYYLGLGELARGWAVLAALVCCVAFALLALHAQHAKHSEEKARGRYWLTVMLVGFGLVGALAGADRAFELGLFPQQILNIDFDLLLIGLFIALASGFALYWHLHGKEGEPAKVARKRGIWVSGMYIGALMLAAFLTWPAGTSFLRWRQPSKIAWTYVRSREALIEEVNKATAQGKPVMVDLWATSCYYCKQYDKVFASDEKLLRKFERIKPIKVDLTDGELPALRGALDIPPDMRPVLVFIDAQGRIRRKADVLAQWLGKGASNEFEAAAKGVHKRLDLILADAK